MSEYTPIKERKESNGKLSGSVPGWRPSIHLNASEVKEIKGWEVGKTYEVAFRLKQTSYSENADGTAGASFEIVGYKVLGESLTPEQAKVKKDMGADEE